MKEIKELILINVRDLVTNFLYYDRKEDEELEYGEIEKAIKEGTITFEEIVNAFAENLKEQIDEA